MEETGIVSKKTIKSVGKVTFSNIISLIVSILTGFLVPKMLSMEAYGLYQSETLYANYVGIIFLGFADGITLKFSGEDYSSLPKYKFSRYLRLEFIWSLLIAIVLDSLCFFPFSSNVKWLLFLVSLDVIFLNFNSQLVSVATLSSRFSLSSKIGVISASVKAILVLALAALYFTHSISEIPFYVYFFAAFTPTIVSMIAFTFSFRDLLFYKGPKDSSFLLGKEIKDLIKTGFPLLASNLIVVLILENDRQFVQIAFPTKIYAVYAFAYSMLRFLSVFVSGMSDVFFPTVKLKKDEEVTKSFGKLFSILVIIFSLLTFVYFPLVLIIKWWLPNYIGSLPIFRVIIGVFCLYSCVTILFFNIFKMRMKNLFFMVVSLLILGLSIGLNFAAYYLVGTTYSISFATLISVSFWYWATIIPIMKTNHQTYWKQHVFLFSSVLFFVFTQQIPWLWLDFLSNFAFFILINSLFFKTIWKQAFADMNGRLHFSSKIKQMGNSFIKALSLDHNPWDYVRKIATPLCFLAGTLIGFFGFDLSEYTAVSEMARISSDQISFVQGVSDPETLPQGNNGSFYNQLQHLSVDFYPSCKTAANNSFSWPDTSIPVSISCNLCAQYDSSEYFDLSISKTFSAINGCEQDSIWINEAAYSLFSSTHSIFQNNKSTYLAVKSGITSSSSSSLKILGIFSSSQSFPLFNQEKPLIIINRASEPLLIPASLCFLACPGTSFLTIRKFRNQSISLLNTLQVREASIIYSSFTNGLLHSLDCNKYSFSMIGCSVVWVFYVVLLVILAFAYAPHYTFFKKCPSDYESQAGLIILPSFYFLLSLVSLAIISASLAAYPFFQEAALFSLGAIIIALVFCCIRPSMKSGRKI